MKYLESSPHEYARLLRIAEEIRAAGYEPIPMTGVRQPFDYERRKAKPCCPCASHRAFG